jgi:hypothetical protein
MAQRSRPPGFGTSPVVALWKGPGQDVREIPLDRGAHGILLSATVSPAVSRSFDGRRPGHDGIEFCGVNVRQIRASGTGLPPPPAPAGPPPLPVLAADELTILTSWAEAMALDYKVFEKPSETLDRFDSVICADLGSKICILGFDISCNMFLNVRFNVIKYLMFENYLNFRKP